MVKVLNNKDINQTKNNKHIGSFFTQSPYLEIKGNKEVLLEGCKSIIEYTPEIIRINTNTMPIIFTGRGLNIKCMSSTGIVIDGYITSIEFIS